MSFLDFWLKIQLIIMLALINGFLAMACFSPEGMGIYFARVVLAFGNAFGQL